MKYMHFKASCSYAALANLLEMQGYDTEDTIIALEMELPKLFSKEDGRHCDPVYGSQYVLWDTEERIREFEQKSEKLRQISDYFAYKLCKYDPRNDVYSSDVIDTVYDVLVKAGVIKEREE